MTILRETMPDGRTVYTVTIERTDWSHPLNYRLAEHLDQAWYRTKRTS